MQVSKYGALAAIAASNYNLEHPGFPVKFLDPDQQRFKAVQILKNFNTENFLLHVDIESRPWQEVSLDDFHARFTFPTVDKASFNQLFEVTSSIHSLVKGLKVSSHMRKAEVDNYSVNDFDELKELLADLPQETIIEYKPLRYPPAGYRALETAGILPPWPGPGMLYRTACLPSNRSDIDRRNSKFPTVFILDSPNANPLNCSDVFRTVGAMQCKNCPSLNGGFSSCSHLGFLFLTLSAPFVMTSVNRPVKLVNIKNKRRFLHPQEILDNLETLDISFNIASRGYDKRNTDALYNPDIIDSDQSDSHIASLSHGSIPLQAVSPSSTPPPPDEDVCQTPESEAGMQPPCHPSTDRPAACSLTRTQGSQSSASSYFGQTGTDIERFLQRMVRRNPSRAIPPQSSISGNTFKGTSYHTNWLWQ